jgi:hypothetical protein
LINEVVSHRLQQRERKEKRKERKNEKGEERDVLKLAMMLEAIYAWRRNGGIGGLAQKSERSDAMMDLRVGSRNSNSIQP